ncbi:MAG: hypothetical protein V4521_07500 [Pseudomonadota bacterium]
MTAKARVLQADVTRIVKGMIDAGVAIGGVRVAPDGEIVVFIPGHIESPLAEPTNPLDEVLLNAPQGKAAR